MVAEPGCVNCPGQRDTEVPRAGLVRGGATSVLFVLKQLHACYRG